MKFFKVIISHCNSIRKFSVVNSVIVIKNVFHGETYFGCGVSPYAGDLFRRPASVKAGRLRGHKPTNLSAGRAIDRNRPPERL